MENDEHTVERIRRVLKDKKVDWKEKRMFGGCAFMVNDKMLCGTYKGNIMARVGPSQVEELLSRGGVEQMMHGGRTMTGYLSVLPDGYDLDTDLEYWVGRCLAFNPKAKSSKKKQVIQLSGKGPCTKQF